ncbi:MAG: hypothetical protein WD941_03650 [Opitutus sp.]
MNSPITFPPPAPELKLPRASEKWAATLVEERRRLQEDLNILRERETNLRDYESRLRAWQNEIDAGRATTTGTRPSHPTPEPFHRPSGAALIADDTALQVAWEKLHRARELLEAEQTHLRDDRIAMHGQEEIMKQREAAVAERETRVFGAEADAAQPIAGEHTISAVARLTRAPFEMARSVFGRKATG